MFRYISITPIIVQKTPHSVSYAIITCTSAEYQHSGDKVRFRKQSKLEGLNLYLLCKTSRGFSSVDLIQFLFSEHSMSRFGFFFLSVQIYLRFSERSLYPELKHPGNLSRNLLRTCRMDIIYEHRFQCVALMCHFYARNS
jgi:hypothetical protein